MFEGDLLEDSTNRHETFCKCNHILQERGMGSVMRIHQEEPLKHFLLRINLCTYSKNDSFAYPVRGIFPNISACHAGWQN